MAGNLPNVVGTIFRTAREAQRLSQEQVAALTEGRTAKISRTTISAIERGRSLPGLEAMVSLSRALNVEPMEIVERVDLSTTVPVDLTDHSADEILDYGRRLLHSQQYHTAVAVFDALSERLVLDPPDDAAEIRLLRVRIENNRALALRRCGALKAAQASAQRAVEFSSGEPELQTNAYMLLASILSTEGLHVLARDASERAVELADSCGPQHQCQAWNQHGNVLMRSGEFDEARRTFLRALELATRTKDHHHRIKIEGNVGGSLTGLGHWKQAKTRFVRAVKLSRRHCEKGAEAFWLVEVGRAALELERLDEADHSAHAALRLARPRRDTLTIFRAEWLRHLIVRRRTPGAADRRRLNLLKKLWPEVKAHRGLAVITEFEQAVIEPARTAKERS